MPTAYTDLAAFNLYVENHTSDGYPARNWIKTNPSLLYVNQEQANVRNNRDFALTMVFLCFVMLASYSVMYAYKRLNRIGVNKDARV